MDATREQDLAVSGVTCGPCAHTLTKLLNALRGVGNAGINVTSRLAFPLSTIRERVR